MKRHSIRRLLFVFLAASGLLVGSCRDARAPDRVSKHRAPERVYLITIDTLRADHLGHYGYPRATSPFLDSLAAGGLVFETAYSSCSHTAPSHASLFTSLQPAQHRLLENGRDLDETIPTLARHFRDRGYRTAAFTTVTFLQGLKAGFDEFSNKGRFHPAATILGEAEAWIRDQPADARLFVWIHLFDVHEWHREDHVEAATLAEVRSQEPSGEALLEYLGREHGVDLGPVDLGWGREKILSAVDRYDGQLLYTDRRIRSFFEAVEGEDVLWIVTSDHGEGLGNHRHMGHGKTIYDEQIRVPLTFYFGDGRYEPRRIGGLVRLVDVAPTLAEFLGGSFDDGPIPIVGQSLLPLFEDPEASWGVRAAFTQRRPADELRLREGWIPGEVYGLRTERYKVIGHSGGQNEIYDLHRDPFELENLYRPEDLTRHDDDSSDKAEHRRLLEGLERRYRALVAQGEKVGTGEINPKYVEELKALGYL